MTHNRVQLLPKINVRHSGAWRANGGKHAMKNYLFLFSFISLAFVA